MGLPVALQLYSVRQETEKDMLGTLAKVAGMGYTGVEFAGFKDIPAKRMKAELDRLGLKAVGSHTGAQLLKEKLNEVMEYNLEIGNKYIVFPYDTYETREDYVRMAAFLEDIGSKLRAAGLRLLYHNHDFEFRMWDRGTGALSQSGGETGMDILFGATSPENLGAELDTGWAFFAGVDPVEYMGKLKGRCPLIHVKDFLNRVEKSFTEVGTGIVDIKSIVGAAPGVGTEWLLVEQDACTLPPLESVKISFDNLTKML